MAADDLSSSSRSSFLGIQATIWAISVSFLLMNVSSTLTYVCMTFYLTTVFRLPKGEAGAIEGAVEGFSYIVRTAAGALSDFVGKRRLFVVIGYIITLLSRVLLMLTNVASLAVSTRFMDKLGNGVQASPREALISDLSPPKSVGLSYGVTRALGTVGSTLGAVLLLFFSDREDRPFFQHMFFVSSLLAGVALLILVLFVKDAPNVCSEPPKRARRSMKAIARTAVEDTKQFSFEYWKIIAVSFLFKIGYFSGSFIMILFQSQHIKTFLGISLEGKPTRAGAIVMVVQNIITSIASLVFGSSFDHVDPRKVVAAGLLCMLCSMLSFGLFGGSAWSICLGIVFYGIQMGMQGALLALLSTAMPVELRGTGFGIFSIFAGIGVFFANEVIMRNLWDKHSPYLAFQMTSIPIVLALVILAFVRRPMPRATCLGD